MKRLFVFSAILLLAAAAWAAWTTGSGTTVSPAASTTPYTFQFTTKADSGYLDVSACTSITAAFDTSISNSDTDAKGLFYACKTSNGRIEDTTNCSDIQPGPNHGNGVADPIQVPAKFVVFHPTVGTQGGDTAQVTINCTTVGTTTSPVDLTSPQSLTNKTLGAGTVISNPGTAPSDPVRFDQLVDAATKVNVDGSSTYTGSQDLGNFKMQEHPTCTNYTFTAGTTPTLGPYSLYGHLVKFSIDGNTADTGSTTGAVATVTGCTTFPNTAGNVQTCSSDLAGGTDIAVSYDGTVGKTGFIAVAPQTITVTIASALNNGSIDICMF